MTDNCRLCRFCRVTLEVGADDPRYYGAEKVRRAEGHCRKNPPQIFQDDNGHGMSSARSGWPEIAPDFDWCGAWEGRG